MEMLIGLAMGAALLYFWLIGHWFARVLVFLGLAGVAGFVGLIAGHEPGPLGIIVGLSGIGLAWLVAEIPTFYWRHWVDAA
ncbi:MAG TPA: hypothetical protein VJV39_21865 [Dongiaceae bacterium]|nr:hypothetical protein [Dongiaceae bacterium]